MAGFAAAEPQRLRGLLQRLHALLSVQAPDATKTAFVRVSREGKPILDEQPPRVFAAAAGESRTYGRGTPLQWALGEARQRWDEFVLVTDGMESAGRVDGVIQVMTEMAQADWAIGLVGAAPRFQGTFYTEMDVPLADALSKIRPPLREQAAAIGEKDWDAHRTDCGTGRNDCYFFRGRRPLLFLLFARSGRLDRLTEAVTRALRENQLGSDRRLQVTPFRSLSLVTELRPANSETGRKVKLPELAKGDSQVRCLVQRNQHLPFEVLVRPSGVLDPPQPSSLRLVRREVAGPKPAWASQVKDAPGAKATEPRAVVDLVCETPGIAERLKSHAGGGEWIARPGRLELRLEQEWVTADSGWWVDWNAENSWQYPYRVYKLLEVVSKVHAAALERHRKAKSLTTTVSLTAAVRR